MAQSVFIEHATPDGWQAASEEFLLYCYNERGIKSPVLHEGDFEYITSDNRAFKQLSIPGHQWSELYPAFTQWIADTNHRSAWVEHGRLWISDGTSVHLKDCRRVSIKDTKK
jgi:hypothetical protein